MRPDRIVRAGVAQVPEGRHVFKELTVEENLRVGASARAKSGVDDSMTQVFDLFPRLKERIKQQAGLALGRRAADGCDRTRADGGALACSCSTRSRSGSRRS